MDDLNNVDFVSSNANSSREEALLYVFEDNEAVIKMVNFYVHLEGVDFVLLLDVQESYISIHSSTDSEIIHWMDVFLAFNSWM